MSAPPVRIQLRRAKGWRMPANTMKVDRSTPWGNPFVVGRHGDRQTCVNYFLILLSGEGVVISLPHDEVEAQLLYLGRFQAFGGLLRGKNLACWCHLCAVHKHGKPFGLHCDACAPCHADTLGVAANRPVLRSSARSKGG